jgi:hypothetical protein
MYINISVQISHFYEYSAPLYKQNILTWCGVFKVTKTANFAIVYPPQIWIRQTESTDESTDDLTLVLRYLAALRSIYHYLLFSKIIFVATQKNICV